MRRRACLAVAFAQALVLHRPRLLGPCRAAHSSVRPAAAEEDDLLLEHDYARSAAHGGAFADEALGEIDELLALRSAAKRDRDYPAADAIRAELAGAYDVYVDDATREWRAGAPPEPAPRPPPAPPARTTGGFVAEAGPAATRPVAAGRRPLEAQGAAFRKLAAAGAAPSQVWARAGGRDFFVGRVVGAGAVARQRDLIAWAARGLHLPLVGRRGDLELLVAADAPDPAVEAWEATPGLEAQPSALAAPADAAPADSRAPEAAAASAVGFLAAKDPLPPAPMGTKIKVWRNRGKSGADVVKEMKPVGAAAGNTGRAQR